jgi:hypothetical protein
MVATHASRDQGKRKTKTDEGGRYPAKADRDVCGLEHGPFFEERFSLVIHSLSARPQDRILAEQCPQ